VRDKIVNATMVAVITGVLFVLVSFGIFLGEVVSGQVGAGWTTAAIWATVLWVIGCAALLAAKWLIDLGAEYEMERLEREES
jgi:TM2 domain-containing membrane protein YozV